MLVTVAVASGGFDMTDSSETGLSAYWKARKRPARLECRYLFSDYDSLRDFLDQAADLSEKDSYYPDMGFGRDYVNITIHAHEGSDISEQQQAFAQALDGLYAAFEPTTD